jgi:hypothetical protein
VGQRTHNQPDEAGKWAKVNANHKNDAVSWANETSFMKNDAVSRANGRPIIQLTASTGQTKIQPWKRKIPVGLSLQQSRYELWIASGFALPMTGGVSSLRRRSLKQSITHNS